MSYRADKTRDWHKKTKTDTYADAGNDNTQLVKTGLG